MKEKIKNAIAVIFLVCFWAFIGIGSMLLIASGRDSSDPTDSIRQQIKNESMISGGFGGY